MVLRGGGSGSLRPPLTLAVRPAAEAEHIDPLPFGKGFFV
jgi:hypothetical protein